MLAFKVSQPFDGGAYMLGRFQHRVRHMRWIVYSMHVDSAGERVIRDSSDSDRRDSHVEEIKIVRGFLGRAGAPAHPLQSRVTFPSVDALFVLSSRSYIVVHVRHSFPLPRDGQLLARCFCLTCGPCPDQSSARDCIDCTTCHSRRESNVECTCHRNTSWLAF